MTAQDPATRSSRNSFLTIAQLVISLGGAFVSILAAAFLLIADRFTQTQPGIDRTGLGQINQLVVMLLLLAFAGIPSIVLCIRWLRGIEPGEAKSNRWLLVASFLLIVWLGALYGGALLLNNGQSSPFLLVVDLFLIALPLIWLLGLALHRIKAGSWKRFWGLVAGTFYITLPIILIVEGIILITAILAASALPGFQDFFNQLSALATSSTESLDQMLNELAPVLASPQAMYTLIFGFGLLIPLVEEFLKPLMLWLFSRRHLTPSQGFAMGLISGAAFALVESLFALNAAGGEDYYAIVLGRTGTGLLHTFTTGMMGWALASTWHDGHGLRLGLIYSGVVILHGIWNSFAIVMGFGSLPFQLPGTVSDLAEAAPWILGLMAVWMLTILYVMNRRLAQEDQPTLPTLV